MEAQDVDVFIKISKGKNTTIKSSTGKILEYKVNINTSILVLNSLNKKKLLDQSYNLSESYKVQDQHSETLQLENKTIENLVSKTYQDILIDISENVLKNDN